MKSLFQHTIYIFVATILFFDPQSISSQTIGLQVDPAHNVLFGDSLTGPGTKLMWLPSKQSLLAGRVTGRKWDLDSIGIYNAVFGLENKVSGDYVLLNGLENEVKRGNRFTILNGVFNTVRENSFYTLVNGVRNVVGQRANYITINGEGNKALSVYETIFGRWADSSHVAENYNHEWIGDHQLFVIGNGTVTDDRNNALTVLKNGNIGLDESTPEVLLHVAEGGDVLLGDSLQGPGKKLMWIAEKSAFRAGELVDNGSPSGKNWDVDSIGNRSVGFGYNNLVKGDMGMAWGESNTVSSTYGTVWGSFNTSVKSSTVWGFRNNADGTDATVWGVDNNIDGQRITAWGRENKASGLTSTVWGRGNDAQSIYETVLGRYAEISNTPERFQWQEDDQLLAIGNGASPSIRNNAFTILKNGNIGINESDPGTLLHIESDQVSGRSIALSLVAGTSKRPSIQFSENSGLAGSLNSGMSIEYDGRSGGSENRIYINSIETAAAGSGLPVVTFKNDGDTDINGFVKIGDEATAVKYKTVTLNTPNSPGFFSSTIHGLDQTKIIGMQASLVDGINTLFPNDRISAWSYTVRVTDTQVRLEIESGSTINNKPVTVTLTYVE